MGILSRDYLESSVAQHPRDEKIFSQGFHSGLFCGLVIGAIMSAIAVLIMWLIK